MRGIGPISRLLLISMLGACEGPRSEQTPLIDITPERFSLPKLAVGSTTESEVQIFNRGAGELRMADFALVDTSSAGGEFALKVRAPDGELLDIGAGDLTVAGRAPDPLRLIVVYTPADEEQATDTGLVRFVTNDSGRPTVEIPITSEESGAEIRVQPTTVNFERVEPGSERSMDLTITNLGVAALRVSAFSITGTDEFQVRDGEQVLSAELPAPFVVDPGSSRRVAASYRPNGPGPDEVELHIRSNAGNAPDLVVNLAANSEVACIQVVPESVEFGASRMVESTDPEVETPNVRPLSILSCGQTELKIFAMRIEGGNDAFAVGETFMAPADGEPIFTLPARLGEANFPSRSLPMEFRPTELLAYGARLILTTNAFPPEVEVSLFGRGVDNECPIPVSVASEYNVQPLDILSLDATPSNDPDGMVRSYIWTVSERPDGSVAKVVERYSDPARPADGGDDDDPSTPVAFFFVDLAGHYTFELVVTDNFGQESCNPRAAIVTVDAVPEKDLHIQLVWTTPDDPDETDGSGTDVDLHLRHQDADGGWNAQANGYDCFFSNKQPDWGTPMDPVDDPTLDIDDTTGAGPENINLSRPEPGVTYDIGALYYRSESSFGGGGDPTIEHVSLVTARVYVRGELLGEYLDRELTAVRQLWWITSVRWCEDFATCPDIEIQDQVLEEAEYTRP